MTEETNGRKKLQWHAAFFAKQIKLGNFSFEHKKTSGYHVCAWQDR